MLQPLFTGPHFLLPEEEPLVTIHVRRRHDFCFAILVVESLFIHSQCVTI